MSTPAAVVAILAAATALRIAVAAIWPNNPVDRYLDRHR